jgi:hypothetical protein
MRKEPRHQETASLASFEATTALNSSHTETPVLEPAARAQLEHSFANISIFDPKPAQSPTVSAMPVIQRQAATPTPDPPSVPPSSSTSSPSAETADAPSFRVRLVAHASPRWRGAGSNEEADRNNLALSQRRAQHVQLEVERIFAKHFPNGASVTTDLVVEHEDGTVGVSSDARGSQDTLLEARGQRQDDAAERRRVDVIIESSQDFKGTAGASRPIINYPTASKFWYVSVDVSAGGSLGAAGSLITLSLKNALTGETMTGKVWAAGVGPKASIGATTSIWSDPTSFSTEDEVNFQDFDGVWVRYTTAGINLFIGYEKSYISFIGLGDDAKSIDVGGFNTGTVGIGGSVVAGKLSLDGPFPPTMLPIPDTDRIVVPYERTEQGQDKHRVLFATGSAELIDLEADILDSFIASAVASHR